jgi:hypothetical protein
MSAPCVGAYFIFRSAMGTGNSRHSIAMRKMTNRKGERGSQQECSRPLLCERRDWEGRGIMNEEELFCFCCQCLCVSIRKCSCKKKKFEMNW